MKKRYWGFSFTLIFIFIFSLPLVYSEKGTPIQTMDREPLKITFIGGSPSGVWYMILNGVTVSINKSYPDSIVTVVPGASLANVARIDSRQGDCSLAHSAICAWALAGREPFKERLNNIAAVASLYPSHFQMVVDKKLGIQSIDEIVQKKLKIRLSVDQPGSAAALTFGRILNEYGVSYEDFERWGGKIFYKNMDDSANMLSDGLIDGYCMVTLYPASSFQEASLNKPLVMLPIKQSVITMLSEKFGYTKATIPAHTYKFNPKDIPTIASYTIIIVAKDSPDEISYKIARSIYENLDYLRSVHGALKDLTPEKLTQNLGIPLHPGAMKFYQEAGILKKDK